MFEILFPDICLACEQYLKPNDRFKHICNNCVTRIEIASPCCPQCLRKNADHRFCVKCSKKFNLKGVIFAAFLHNAIIKKLIIEFKYNGLYDLSQMFAYLIATKIKKMDLDLTNTLLSPVPLDKQKLNLRGFNQNELIALNLEKLLNIKTFNILIKHKSNLPQVYIKNTKLRRENIKNVFSINKKIVTNNSKQKTILLLDDVSTTHSTLNECAKVLKQYGFSSIWGITIAKG